MPTWPFTFARWLGLRGAVALLALILCAGLYVSGKRLQTRLALSEASVAVLEAQRDAANALAADYQARANAAVAAEQAERAARQAEAKARGRKWDRIVKDEREWAEVPVPQSVIEGLR